MRLGAENDARTRSPRNIISQVERGTAGPGADCPRTPVDIWARKKTLEARQDQPAADHQRRKHPRHRDVAHRQAEGADPVEDDGRDDLAQSHEQMKQLTATGFWQPSPVLQS